LIPDAGFLVKSERGFYPVFLVELDKGTEAVSKIMGKLQKYDQWWLEGAGEYLTELYAAFGAKRPIATFRLLLVMHHADPKTELTRYEAVSERVRKLAIYPRIYLTTASVLGKCFDGPIWSRHGEKVSLL
jgi:hypothetical protein